MFEVLAAKYAGCRAIDENEAGKRKCESNRDEVMGERSSFAQHKEIGGCDPGMDV